MMKLTENQVNFVKQLIEAGSEISELQSKLAAEFDVHLTYMDTRFLIDDLALELKKEEPTVENEQNSIADGELVDEQQSSVRVEVDSLVRPGSVINGSVVFSDGKKASWSIDNFGRLALKPDTYGYRPSEEDLVEFQRLIQEKL